MTAIPVVRTETEFTAQLDKFVAGAQEIINKHFADHYASKPPKLEIRSGTRYIKIMRETSVHCLVDKTNGNVLKAAGFNAPAKHARGNIFNADAGVGGVSQWGGRYLR